MKNTADSRSRQIDSILFKTEACYPAGEFGPASIDVWHEALAEFDIEEISMAFSNHVKESRFLPTISEIVDRIKKNKRPQVSIEARAQRQWRIVLTAVARHGRAKPPVFADPITAKLVKSQFRWQYLCDMKQENENWEQKRWCEAFELAVEAHPDMKQIDAPHQVQKLANKIAKPVNESTSLHEVPVETIAAFRKKLRGHVQGRVDPKARILELKRQAKRISKDDKYERDRVEEIID